MPGDVEAQLRACGITTLDVSVPVAGLSSGERAMDENLRDAMHAEQFRDVHFRMRSCEVKVPGLVVHGTLEIAGVSREADLSASLARTDTGVRIIGTEALRMSDFGIVPPTLFLGTLRTADAITVGFEVVVPASLPPAPAP